MTRDATQVCATPGCWQLRPCPTHTPKPWAGSTRHATLPPDWNRRRQRTLTRDRHTCTNCGWHDPTGTTLECDHIGDRLDHNPANLTTLCGKGSTLDCHGAKTKRQTTAGRRGRTR